MDPYYRGNVVSALGDLLAEKAGVNIGLVGESFAKELNRIADTLGAEKYSGIIDPETMDRIYTFFLPNVKDERDGWLARSVRQHDP